ncbi:hypothetical protein ACFL49_00610 [Candidatus Omnitrophota bacterium]
MKKFFILLLLIVSPILFAVRLSFADTPITSTHFYKAYLDISLVQKAADTHILNREIMEYLSKDNEPIDIKMAIINALSWVNEEAAIANVHRYQTFLDKKYEVSFEILKIDNMKAIDKLCLGYLMVIAKYYYSENPGFYLIGSSSEELNGSFTAALIWGLSTAQLMHLDANDEFDKVRIKYLEKIEKNSKYSSLNAEDKVMIATSVALEDLDRGITESMHNTLSCMEWIEIDEVYTDKSLNLDMREEAKKIILDYMEGYKEYCSEGEKFLGVSPTRG